MPASADDQSTLKVPRPLQILSDWGNALLVLSTILVAVLSYFFGGDVAGIVTALSIGSLLVFYVLIIFTRRNLKAAAQAEKLLSAQEPRTDEREKILREVRRAVTTAKILFTVLYLAAAAAIVLLLYQPVYRLLRTKVPQTVEFESLRYFDPTRDSGLFEQSPFLQAVTTYLKDEAKSEDRNARILLGTTTAFSHPTPTATITVVHNDPGYVITGYAFRLRHIQKSLFYEPVPLRYSPSGPVEFALPSCDAGDRIFFVGRLSLPDKNAAFPEDLKNVMKFSVEAKK